VNALPYSTLQSSVQKPRRVYPKALKTIGNHLRKRRLDLKLSQEKVANILGVSLRAIYAWEKGEKNPWITRMPKVVEFLGYNPRIQSTVTLGAEIKAYRLLHGLSLRELGKLSGIGATTIGRLERNMGGADKETLEKLNRIINTTK